MLRRQLLLALTLQWLEISSLFDKAFAWEPVVREDSDAQLFAPAQNEIRILAPSHFPPPTHMLASREGGSVAVVVRPSFGQHRSDQDAIFAYAEGYSLQYYCQFLETLTATGYRGDVVLAISEERIVREHVVEYLQNFTNTDGTKPNVVVYQYALDCTPMDGDVERVRHVMPTGDTDAFQMCQLDHVYGWKDKDDKVIETATDPRQGRVVATLRYEWYWIWAQQYLAHSWIMLIDARDTYFQSDPFANVPRDTSNAEDGLLYFFGENTEATRLGISNKNRKWIRNGYGPAIMDILKEKPTICSGSTMGEQIAVETYLRAMVNEHDESTVRMTGSDQGFHNYLYYSGKLAQAMAIRTLVVWDQGRGIINNIGAMRTKPLEEWGCYNKETHQVFQWDGKTPSPVVHQFDRDKHLHGYIVGEMHRVWREAFEANLKK